MQERSDIQLLRDYANGGHEVAFRELVDRHADFVYSAALRQVVSPDLARDISQGVFTDLARKAGEVATRMADCSSLAGWLHRSTRYAALKHHRDTQRRLANEEQAMKQLLVNCDPNPDWEAIRLMLDEALDSLSDVDREAILLRYFKNQDFRAVGLALGISDDTAQKRVSRATERLNEFFSKRNVTIGTGGLIALISANGVQAAPVGLAASMGAVAIASGTTAAATAIATAKIITMTTLQKSLVACAFLVVVGAGVYEARQAGLLREENRDLEHERATLAVQLEELKQERDSASNRVAALSAELAVAKKSPSEVLKLRSAVGTLRQQKTAAEAETLASKLASNPEARKAIREHNKMQISGAFADLAKRLQWTPEQKGQFDDLLADHSMNTIDLIMQGLRDGKSQAELRQIFAASDAAFHDKMRAQFGDEALTQYKEYTSHIADNSFVAALGQGLTGDAATVADKKQRLLQALQEARLSELAAAGLPPDYQTTVALNQLNFVSAEAADQNLQLKDKIFGDAAARASGFLTADELKKFQETRTNAINYTRNLIEMNRNLLGPGK